MRFKISVSISLLVLGACSGNKEGSNSSIQQKPEKNVEVPAFNADSAYHFVKTQVDFGPRVPNTTAHKAASSYLQDQLERFGATVIAQSFESPTVDGNRVKLTNIIGSFFPEKKKRILLAAHWDTRPYADRDEEDPNASFDGANDGASGVGVLLEIARQLSLGPAPDVGVDIIFFDGEDWGERYGETSPQPKPNGLTEWWCLGSQHWARNKHKANYTAFFGILLDMVGGVESRFAYEVNSLNYAPSIVDKVWKTAARIGHGDRFINRKGQTPITDDHVFVNEVAKIPMIDIIAYDPATGGFGDFHHTRNDNMQIISRETLRAVGETVLAVVYYE